MLYLPTADRLGLARAMTRCNYFVSQHAARHLVDVPSPLTARVELCKQFLDTAAASSGKQPRL